MVIRQRAVQAEDKQERHDAILDAAERLLLRSPERVANVAEVAEEALLAKGTVYLYFPSKEELLLALHERNVDGFFRAVMALVERRGAGRHRRHARADPALHGRAAALPAARVAVLRADGAEHSRRGRSGVPRADVRPPAARRRGTRAPLSRARRRRRSAAPAPFLRAHHRPVADVGRGQARRAPTEATHHRRPSHGATTRTSSARCAPSGGGAIAGALAPATIAGGA